ncbi:MAG: DUF1062 domain-containing protein [Lachnospiraceae bacterium]|nr:DUF1062 domain-containing protein [Lachnospiraceae bacterium]
MCYQYKKIKIVPKHSYEVIRNCSKCGCKMNYVNTGRFRVNANGRRIDVWLIYQCEKCKHTLNLSIYERVNPEMIPGDEYKKFLANDEECALEYGTNYPLFAKNKAQICDEKIEYLIKEEIVPQKENLESTIFHIENLLAKKIRTDKFVSELLGLSRSKIQEYVREGKISEFDKYISDFIEIQTCIEKMSEATLEA